MSINASSNRGVTGTKLGLFSEVEKLGAWVFRSLGQNEPQVPALDDTVDHSICVKRLGQKSTTVPLEALNLKRPS